MSPLFVNTGAIPGVFNRIKARINEFRTTKADARMNDIGRRVVERAKELVPVRTGAERDSIGYTYNQSTKTLQFHEDVPYGYFVEYGTRFMLARPHLRPALNEVLGRSANTGIAQVQLQFANTPHLKGTTRKPNQRVIKANTRQTRRLHSWNEAGRAAVVVRRGKWNGPNAGASPWQHKWNGMPGAIPNE